MKRRFLGGGLLLISLTLACSRSAAIQTNSSTVTPTESQKTRTAAPQNQELLNQIEQIAAAAKGRVGVAAVVLETGQSVSLSPHDHFPMQSVYKLPIGMAVMTQVDSGKIKLEQTVSVTKSDFVRRGQHSPVRDQHPNGAELSVSGLLRALQERRGLSETSRTLLLKLMIESTPGPKRLKGLLPAGTVVAHKTGTSGTQNGMTAATNDIGLITLPNGQHLAIAVFVSDSSADEATREAVIAKVARAVWEKCSE